MAQDGLTSFLKLTKPVVNDPAGEDLWGQKLNTNFDILDDFAAKQGALNEAPQDNKVYGRGTPNNWQEVVTPEMLDEAVVEADARDDSQDAAIAGKEPAIAPGTVNDYWRGDKTWQVLPIVTWANLPGIPATFPPTLPIPSSGVTGLDAKQASQDAAITSNATAITGKEPAIAAGNPAYFWAGDKTWKPVPAAGIAEAPTDGQLYSRKGSTTSWVVASAGAVVSDTAPTGMPVSTIWWNSAQGGLYIDYQDPNSRQWVMVNAPGMPEANKDGKPYARKDGGWFDLTATLAAKADDTDLANYLPLTGGSISGPLVGNTAWTCTVNVSGSYAMVATNQNTGGGGVIGYSGATYGILGYGGYSLYGNGAVYASGGGTFGGQVSGANLVSGSNLSFTSVPNMVLGYANDTTWTIISSSHFQFAYSGTVRHRLEVNIWRSLVDSTCSLGTGSYRFTTVNASTGTINTSDERLKQDIAPLTEAEKRVAVALRGLIVTYRSIQSVEEKGDDARVHTGVIAQRVADAFAAEGLDVARYGLWCADEEVIWHSEVIEEIDGVSTKVKDGYEEPTGFTRYSIRYDELLCFIIGGL